VMPGTRYVQGLLLRLNGTACGSLRRGK
jgi:hypothetical protein